MISFAIHVNKVTTKKAEMMLIQMKCKSDFETPPGAHWPASPGHMLNTWQLLLAFLKSQKQMS